MDCCLWGRIESDTTEATYQQQQARSNKIEPRCFFFENYHLVNSLSKFSSSGLSLGTQLFHLDQS